MDKESALFILHMEDSPLVPGTLLVGPAQCKPEFQWISNSLQEFKYFCKARWKQNNNKLASLVATLVRNYDPACDSLTRVKSRATSVAKNLQMR